MPQIDAVQAAPEHYKVELENEHARVLRIRYGPKEKSPRHSHPATVVIMLTESNIRFHMPDGSTQDIRGKAGEVLAPPPGDHAPENLNDSPMEAILVEFKTTGRKKTTARKSTGRKQTTARKSTGARKKKTTARRSTGRK